MKHHYKDGWSKIHLKNQREAAKNSSANNSLPTFFSNLPPFGENKICKLGSIFVEVISNNPQTWKPHLFFGLFFCSNAENFYVHMPIKKTLTYLS